MRGFRVRTQVRGAGQAAEFKENLHDPHGFGGDGVGGVLIGINLLREGLDLPEVSLVAILDADKEGFLRSATSLIQTMGRSDTPTSTVR